MSKPKEKTSLSISLKNRETFAVVEISQLQNVAVQQLAAIPRLQREAALRAILCGFTLHRVKATVDHGQWMPWLNQITTTGGNLPNRSQCNYYMRLADVAVEKMKATRPELLALPGDQSELTLDTADGQTRAFMEKLTKFVGTKSLNELLDEHGIKNAKQVGGKREAGDESAPTPSAEELYTQSRDEIGGIIQRAETMFFTENRLQYMAGHPEEITGVVTGLRSLADKVEAAAKSILKADSAQS